MDTRVKVLIGVPTMGDMNVNLAARIIKWTQHTPPGDLACYFTYKVQPVDRARNQIVDFFLERKDLTHLLFIDSDTVPPPDAIKKLLLQNKDIVTGLTPILHHDREKNIWGTFYNAFWRAVGKPGVKTECCQANTGTRVVERCGGSCLLIKREVFNKLKRPFFKFVLGDEGTKHVVSEDVYFCDQAREAGLEIWADTSVVCQHYKTVRL